MIFLLPYLLMFPAVAVLRRKDPDRERPFRIPGGNGVVIGLATLTTLVIAAATLLFIWPEVPNAPGRMGLHRAAAGDRGRRPGRRRGDHLAHGPSARARSPRRPTREPQAGPPRSATGSSGA